MSTKQYLEAWSNHPLTLALNRIGLPLLGTLLAFSGYMVWDDFKNMRTMVSDHDKRILIIENTSFTSSDADEIKADIRREIGQQIGPLQSDLKNLRVDIQALTKALLQGRQ